MAQSICLLPANKDWTYLKIDNAKKTGTGGMRMLTEEYNMVLEIIGKMSPVICGLGAAESFEKHQEQSCETIPEDDSEGIVNKSRPISEHVTPSTSKATYGKRKRVTANNACTDNASALKQEKLTLQVEYLKLKNYRTKLEIRKLDQELQLPISEFTSTLPQHNYEIENGRCYQNL
ncbi:unnamed protein product [Psylliodes chrysocephalus]|uniref:Uncharacterized protein n=1 Tax=Psylliodes chrysocephalus TaxID=3402493 RepID=A0A9P0D6P8_9CUCU|nr:unnamed protein product [Psylliodes chrysocephala]